jgi:hypothetical protein
MTPATTGKDFGDMPTLAPLRERLGELASRNIFVGTSSWKYEGWLGQLYSPGRCEYRGKIAKTRFEAECLSEYAETFRTVCVDAGFYRFPDEKYIANLASKVPDGVTKIPPSEYDELFTFICYTAISARRDES